MKVEITNVNGETNNQWVGKQGEAVRSFIYPGSEDYFVEVKTENLSLLFRLSEINIVHDEIPHWFLTIYPQRVEGRCSDGRAFGQSSLMPQLWLHGFTTALDMSGQAYEIREED